MEGAAVIDPHDDAPAVVQIGDIDITGQGQVLVRCGHAIHVIDFTAGGAVTVKFFAIPGGDTPLFKAVRLVHDMIAFAHDHITGVIAVFTTRFRARHGIGDTVAIEVVARSTVLADGITRGTA